MIKPGNIGAITIDDNGALWIVDSVHNGLIYCRPINGPRQTRIVLADQFWSLLDSLLPEPCHSSPGFKPGFFWDCLRSEC